MGYPYPLPIGDFRTEFPNMTDEKSLINLAGWGLESIVNFTVHQGLCLRFVFVKHVKIKALEVPLSNIHI